ncbi:major capsid protein [Gordonia sp. PDNC005]|uniref:major capsid protein n=1 Tax=Gordonia sp. PDNC005 TaxID=2811424 RepID=UPI0019655A55|nr:major capsid protein [Gordonia sp. PDNC005]QRY62748.1 major capsid protein [Gordonia sp. PDNC005]
MATLDLQAILDSAQGNGDTTADERAAAIKAALTAEGVTRTDIEGVLNEAVEKFGALNESDPTDAEALTGLELLADVATVARQVQTDMDTAEAEIRGQRDTLAAKVLGEPGDDAGAEAEATDETTEQVADAEAAPEPVTAAAAPRPRFNLSSIKDKAPAPVETKPSGLAITAAAGVRGVENGANLDMDGLVAAAMARIEGMPRGGGGGIVRDGIAQIKIEFPDDLVASGNNDTEVIEHAGDQSRIEGGLVASGGWCAPSERLYDLGDNLADANEGLVDVPEIQVKRGGIEWTRGAAYDAVWAGDVGLVQTETQAIANTIKSLYRPTCPTFEEKRLDVIYSGMIVGFLQNDAYPEVTKDALTNVNAVHSHRVNAETLKRMDTASTVVDLSTKLGPSATGSILNGLGLTIMDSRYRLRAAQSLVLDVVLPIWAKEVVKADYSLRESIPLENVTDQMIDKWISERGGRVQWVYDWQDAYTGVAAGFGAATAITQYPTTVDALVYPSGAFVRGRGEVINLDMVYDSTMTKANDYLQMFMEEKLLVAKRAHFSKKVKLGLGVNGATGTGLALDANGKIATVTP